MTMSVTTNVIIMPYNIMFSSRLRLRAALDLRGLQSIYVNTHNTNNSSNNDDDDNSNNNNNK